MSRLALWLGILTRNLTFYLKCDTLKPKFVNWRKNSMTLVHFWFLFCSLGEVLVFSF